MKKTLSDLNEKDMKIKADERGDGQKEKNGEAESVAGQTRFK